MKKQSFSEKKPRKLSKYSIILITNLQTLCVNSTSHEGFNPSTKEATTANKQRLQRLCIDFEKQAFPHIKDYDVVENTLKEIIKIIDQRVL
jgi:hypothetical protein